MLELRRTTSHDPGFGSLVIELDADLSVRYGHVAGAAAYVGHNVLADDVSVIVAVEGHTAVGCGAFRPFDTHSVELKRMFVVPTHRRRGVARAVLGELEDWARECGFTDAVLETGVLQTEAIELYRSAGYRSIPILGSYVGLPLSECFAKALVVRSRTPVGAA